MQLLIDPSGTVRCIYAETMDLHAGDFHTFLCRAIHILRDITLSITTAPGGTRGALDTTDAAVGNLLVGNVRIITEVEPAASSKAYGTKRKYRGARRTYPEVRH